MPIIVKYYPSLFGQKRKVKARYIVDENGKRQGLFQSYYRDGSEHITCWYRDDKRKGKYVSKHPNGRTATECFYGDDEKLEGDYKTFFATGLPSFLGHFQKNLGEGKQTWFRPNGEISYSEIQHLGLRDGESVSYSYDEITHTLHEGGIEKGISQYAMGHSTKTVQRFHQNTLLGQDQYLYDAEQHLTEHIAFNSDGKTQHTTYFPNGQVSATWTEENFVKHGVLTRFSESGHKLEVCPYNRGDIHGKRVLFYDNADNSVREESDYSKGKIGFSILRDETGKVSGKYRYSKGKRIVLRHMSELLFYKLADKERRDTTAQDIIRLQREKKHGEARLLAKQFHSEQSDIPRRTALKLDKEHYRS